MAREKKKRMLLGRLATRYQCGIRRISSKQDHWNTVYKTKESDKVSWYQKRPDLSLELIRSVTTKPASETSVIDIGGGASFVVDSLLEEGYTKVAVLDISGESLEISKQRLGEKAEEVQWIEGDITALQNLGSFDVWHDRAVFHFLIESSDQGKYIKLLNETVPVGGHLIISTFALDGPDKCSMLPVCKYDCETLSKAFEPSFVLLRHQKHQHLTPLGNVQPFIFAVLKKVL